MEWQRRNFDALGLTQYPVGRHIGALRARFGGSVVLCLDVSGSMFGARLEQAKQGCDRFVTDALDAGYSVSGLLWHHSVAGYSPLSHDRKATDELFRGATAAGGNAIVPTLRQCEKLLDGRTGDLVIAIFGDGDLGPADEARRHAALIAEKNIRVLTCGLGAQSAEQIGTISTEDASVPPRVAVEGRIADAIAGMAAGLQRRPR